MKRLRTVFFVLLGGLMLTLGLSHSPAQAEMLVPLAPTEGYVVDQTDTLTPDQITELNQLITGTRERTSVQLAVLVVPMITNDYLENFSLNVARSWGIGEAGKNNGALLLVAKNDRKMRIEVGTGLEGDLTDLRAGRIIRDRIAPEFKKENYFVGIKAGLEGMILAVGDTPDPLLKADDNNWAQNLEGIITWVLVFGVMGLSWLSSILGAFNLRIGFD